MDDSSLDAVFAALANEHRRRMLDIVKDKPGCNVNHVTRFFPLSRIAVLKHLRVLEQAGLIVSSKSGRVRVLHFNCVPIQLIHDRWTTAYSALWAQGLARLKYQVENREDQDG